MTIPTEIPKALIEEFMKVLDCGDEKTTEDFLVTHLNEFPEGIRDEIIFGLTMNAVEEDYEDTKMREKFASEILELMKEVEKAEETLEKKKKLLDIKESL